MASEVHRCRQNRVRLRDERGIALPLSLRAARELLAMETIVEGLDSAPDAFIGLFAGENFGKMLVKLADT